MRNRVMIVIALCAGVMAATAQGMRPTFPFAGRGQRFSAHSDGRVGPRHGLESAFDPSSFMIDTSVVYGPAMGDQRQPAMASDGAGWLVVWSDSRDYTLRAGRLDANGVLLDTSGIVIAGITDYYQMQANVTFDGENYLVVWGTGSEYNSDVCAAHISPAGELLDTFTVSAEQEGQSRPAVASAGDTSLVVWVDTRDFEANLYAARVLRSGEVVDPAGFSVAPLFESYNTAISVERGGDEFLVAWSDYAGDTMWTENVFAMRIGVDGTLKDTGAVRLSTSDMEAMNPTVAFGDTFFLVAWEEIDYSSLNVVGRRVTVNGTLLDPNYIRIAPFSNEQEDAAATFDGSNFLVTWIDYDYSSYLQTVRARRVTTGGVLLDPNQIRICPEQTSAASPAACCNGTDFVVALEGYGADDADVFCARVSPAGVVRDPSGIPVPLGVESQESPSVAFDGVNYLTVWYEQDSIGAPSVCGARVTPAGAVLDPKGFSIGAGPSLPYGGVAFGAGEYLVAWTSVTENSDSIVVRAARVTPGGTLLDTIPLQPGTGMGYDVAPDVAFDGTNFLVVWCCPMDSGPGIYGARVAPDGTILDPVGFPISDGRGYEILPSVAFDSANYIVTWSGNDGYYSDVYCALVSPDGSVVVPTALVSGDSCDQAYPKVACGPSSSLIVWMDDRINGSYSDICAARVSHSGEVLDPEGILVTNSSYDEQLSDVVFDGSAYQLFWSRFSLDSACYSGAKLDTAGRTLSLFRPFGRADNSYYGGTIGAAAGAAGEALAVYQSWTDEAGGREYGNYRIWGRLGPFDGVADTRSAELTTTRRVQTIVRGVLFLPELGTRSELPGSNSAMSRAALLDISGRRVLDLHAGANDVSRLAPGVYFVSEVQAQAVQKIVLTR